jgi:penicillin-binding protein 1A
MLKFLKRILAIFLCVGILAFAAVKIGFWYVASRPDMPKVEDLFGDQKQMTRITSDDDTVICEVGSERRIVISFTDIPSVAIKAFIAAEDADFWEHNGYDFRGLVRSGYKYLFKGKKQGASTIDQQVIKNLLFVKKDADGKAALRDPKQKAKEIVLAIKLVDFLTKKLGSKRAAKEWIITKYLNTISFGNGRFGIEAASQYYFGHGAATMNLLEAVTLAAMPKDPTRYNPRHTKPRKGHKLSDNAERRVYVLDQLRKTGKIGDKEYFELKNASPRIVPPRSEASAAAQEVCDNVKEKLYDAYCTGLNYRKSDRDKQICGERVSNLGIVVKTTIDLKLQLALKQIAKPGVDTIARRHNKTVSPQVAIVVVENATGNVKTMLGGSPYETGGTNYARMPRQPGSLFKVFDYGAGFAGGDFTPNTTFVDYQMFLKGPEKEWPHNYEPEHMGPVTVKTAMAHSLNTVAMQALIQVGPKRVINFARKFGIKSRLEPDLSLALGSYELTPMEIAGAYSAIARGGRYLQPMIVTEIGEKVLPREENEATKPWVAEELLDLLHEVIATGTGKGANGVVNELLYGKTGTTSNHSDAWFAGFTKKYTVVVWVGNDKAKDSLGAKETGASAALPIWADVVSFLYTGHTADRVKKMSTKLVPEKADKAAEEAAEEGEEIVEDDVFGVTADGEVILNDQVLPKSESEAKPELIKDTEPAKTTEPSAPKAAEPDKATDEPRLKVEPIVPKNEPEMSDELREIMEKKAAKDQTEAEALRTGTLTH